MVIPLLVTLVLGAEPGPVRRGVIESGLSLSLALGMTEGFDGGAPSLNFTQEVALAFEVTPRWVAQLSLRVARGTPPATIAVAGSLVHRFVWKKGQPVVPFLGGGVVVAGVSTRPSDSGLGVGLSADGGLDWCLTRWFALTLRVAGTFVLGGLNATTTAFLHQTLGLTVSL